MTVAEKILRAKDDYDAVYESGYAKGQAEGGDSEEAYNEGFEAGKKSEYDTFWDEYQEKGAPHMHHYKFAGTKWNDNTFKPKYDIKPRWGSNYTFALCGVKDLVASLKAQGRVLDTKEASDMRYFCYSIQSKTFPTLDFSGINASNLKVQSNIFSESKNIETIEKIILKDGLTFSGWFSYCTALRDVRFEGSIGSDISFKDSPLLLGASIENIIGCLSDTASGKTLTLSQTAVNNAFSETEWDALEATKTNWTITLV